MSNATPHSLSRKLGRIVEQHLSSSGLSAHEGYKRLDLDRSYSTFRRLIAGQSWNVDTAKSVIERIAPDLGTVPEEIWSHLLRVDGNVATKCGELEGITRAFVLPQEAVALFRTSERYLLGGECAVYFGLVPWLLPDNLIPTALAGQGAAGDSRELRAEIRLARRERQQFLQVEPSKTATRVVLLSRRYLEAERATGSLLVGFSAADRDETCESIHHDAIEERGVSIAIIEDLLPEFPRELFEHFRPFRLVSALDSRIVFKQRWCSFVRVCFERTGIVQRDARLEYELKMIRELLRWDRLGQSTPALVQELFSYLHEA